MEIYFISLKVITYLCRYYLYFYIIIAFVNENKELTEMRVENNKLLDIHLCDISSLKNILSKERQVILLQ